MLHFICEFYLRLLHVFESIFKCCDFACAWFYFKLKKKTNPNYTCTEWWLIILLTSSQTITISFVTDFIFFTLSTLCRAICIIEPVLTYCLKSHNSLNREKKFTKKINNNKIKKTNPHAI